MTAIAPHHPAALPDAQTLADDLKAILEASAFADLDQLGWVAVTGSDRVRWLNGMTTNAIQQLEPGQLAYNFLLSAQGRIQGDAYAFAEPNRILLETDRTRIPALIALLDHFIIMDDVELQPLSDPALTETRQGLLCAGPIAADTLAALGLDAATLSELHFANLDWQGATVTLIHAYSPLVPRFELWADPATVERLKSALAAAHATPVSAITVEHLRLLEGTPRYGVDIRDRELPQETAQTRALHFSKGCYLGQEIVERIRSRGNVHRTLQAFILKGGPAAPGTVLESNSKPVGELTSVAELPLASGPLRIALGYIRREALSGGLSGGDDRRLPILYPSGEAVPVATPIRPQAIP